MNGGENFNTVKEFAGINFREKRLEKRFKRTMETLSRNPEQSIYSCCATRAESKAIYNLLGKEKFQESEILRCHRESTIRRMTGEKVILAVQDTTSINYDTQRKMKGNGYVGDKTMGVNIHSCIAVTTEGLVLGVLDQSGFNREVAKEEGLTREQQKNRPIEEKESFRWLETMERSDKDIPEGIKVIHLSDREGDIYELFEKAIKSGRLFLTRIAKNRMTTENTRILDEIRLKPSAGTVIATIPRDTRRDRRQRSWRKREI